MFNKTLEQTSFTDFQNTINSDINLQQSEQHLSVGSEILPHSIPFQEKKVLYLNFTQPSDTNNLINIQIKNILSDINSSSSQNECIETHFRKMRKKSINNSNTNNFSNSNNSELFEFHNIILELSNSTLHLKKRLNKLEKESIATNEHINGLLAELESKNWISNNTLQKRTFSNNRHIKEFLVARRKAKRLTILYYRLLSFSLFLSITLIGLMILKLIV